MAEKIKGWDTTAITQVGILDKDRMRLEFQGTEGMKRNIFIPLASVGHLVATLVALTTEAHQRGLIAEQDLSKHLVGVSDIRILSDAAGTEFVLSVVTRDKIDLRFRLERRAFQVLAQSLNEALSIHRISPLPRSPEGSKH